MQERRHPSKRRAHVGAPQGANAAVPNATTGGEHPSADVRGLRRSYRGTIAEICRGADYKAAKAGNATAAGRLLRDLAADFIKDTARQFGDSVLFVAPHAREASGDNAIPQMLATALAIASGGRADESIVQRERVFHTGADPMERISLRIPTHRDRPFREGCDR